MKAAGMFARGLADDGRGVAEHVGNPFVEGADVVLVRYEHATVRVEP